MRFIPHKIMTAAVVVMLSIAPACAQDAKTEALRQKAKDLNLVINDSTARKQIEALAKDKAGSKELVAIAVEMVKEKNQPLNFSALYILGNVALDLNDLKASTIFFELATSKAEKMGSDKKIIDAYTGLADVYSAAKRFDDAEKICKKLLEMQAESEDGLRDIVMARLTAIRMLVRIKANQGKADEAQKILDPYLKTADDNLVILDIHGSLLAHQAKYKEAAAVYEKVVKELAENNFPEDTQDHYKEVLASMYGEMGDIEKATSILLPILKRKPDNPGLNNDLGYMWADKDRNLDEAEKMIRKAVAAEPENASFLDSMGWVLFKKKQFEEAKKYLLKSVEFERGRSTEVYDHLGDVHAALNEKAEAIAAWKKAIEVATPSGRDQQRKAAIEKKIKDMGE
jgi:tetratricopeptide (TPR) repeat protein